MIFEWILSLPAYFLQSIIMLLPQSSGVPTEWIESLYTMWGYVNAFSFIVPVNTIVFCLSTIMGYYLIVFGFDLIAWLLKKIPGVN